MDKRFIYKLNDKPATAGRVVYWMSRDQRVQDNRAMIFAAERAKQTGFGFAVVFCVAPGFPNANAFHYRFMLDGLKEVQQELESLNIPFFLLTGRPQDEIPEFVKHYKVKALVCDFMPLKVPMAWRAEVAASLDIPVYEVDAHNVVPCRFVSNKQEYAARTIRPKIHRYLGEFLTELPRIERQEAVFSQSVPSADWKRAEGFYPCGGSFPLPTGTKAGLETLADFVSEGIHRYDEGRNDPNEDAQSKMSPYFHFGQVAPQRAALDVLNSDAPQADKDAYIEELIVRRELSDNYCLYNPRYDSIEGADGWALKTLDEHRIDMREYVYIYEEFEAAKTHDPLWNAAQKQLRHTGRIHGYMRMYWAKKILEWTPDPETAFGYALLLNDTYALDGRDPNGYVGVAWSIAGVHDRAWFERPVFGKIRYMNYNGCKSKFDIESYIKKARF
ncbi:deoxyribodipyrimidine photo-lyase [Seleniivibrio woodruffii]|uniref:Deoxyribodipyrimidine photo-lyase n=1 Tax=Seleniivibrio woodruffii TaxID=1078050 RepID=A0A4R1K7Z3_9BACT|nr:deoxyribodipyrimidine photo-lyase [Seleniivibrio woodruffii]TCK60412.1 deoxyribodipyrimidine photo-lyase type II [Seleniivibrio woodruffii]TVZ36040.1 deoxyribodipyrimidine photo-lyase type II [Seleniivibrio woodruffii]